MNAVAACVASVRQEVDFWNKYKALWELDIDACMRRFCHCQKPLESIMNDIMRYSAQINEIESEESIRTCAFIEIDVSKLKLSLIEKCKIWKHKLTKVLHDKAKKHLFDIFNISYDKGVDGLRTFDQLKKNNEELKTAYRELVDSECEVTSEEHELLNKIWTKTINESSIQEV